MKIEIWSDFTCPFCYIGKRKLEEALSHFPYKDKVEVEFKSYQLDPTASPYTGQDFYESMAPKFGGVKQARRMMVGIVNQAKEEGLDFRFDTMKPTNTFKAHRLTKLAKKYNKDTEVTEKLLYANFTESKDVGNEEVLLEIATAVGIDEKEALSVLQDETNYAQDVNEDIAEARDLGVSGVPYFIFNRKYALSGAQPSEVFTQALERVWEEEKEIPQFETLTPENESGGVCDNDDCEI